MQTRRLGSTSLQSSRVGAEINQLRGEVEPKDKMFSLDLAVINLKRVLQETVCIDNFEVELDLPFADAGQIEKVVDKPRLQLHVPANHME